MIWAAFVREDVALGISVAVIHSEQPKRYRVPLRMCEMKEG